MSGVLRQYEITRLECVQRTQGDVLQVSNRGGYHEEHAFAGQGSLEGF